ncbi:MAG: hypothetical protein V3T17_07440 [Pseudomonadales bacterium]
MGNTLELNTGDMIGFKADNGKWLSRINRGLPEPIEAAKSEVDVYCKFEVLVLELDDFKVALKADNGKWLGLRDRSGVEAIEAGFGERVQECSFTFNVVDDLRIVLKADNGKWLGRVNRGLPEPIEAAKSEINSYCLFRVINFNLSYAFGTP